MLKHLTKLAMEILPSVLATIIGAYIVNHYINATPATNTPAAAVSAKTDAKSDPSKADSKGATDVASLPEPGVKAKGVAEKSIFSFGRASTESAPDKPVEASIAPVDAPRRNPVVPKTDKAAKTAPAAAVPAASAPTVTAPAAPAETASAPDEHRDAADLARAAIERLRATGDASQHGQDTARAPDAPKVQDSRAQDPRAQDPRSQDTPRVIVAAPPPPAVRPLPPPISVGGSGADTSVAAAPPLNPPYTGAVRADDPSRPTPPAEIPPPPPLDLRATTMNPREQATKVAEGMLSAAKSVFQAVMPRRDRDSGE
jgi:hypothetical protein